MSIAVEFFKVFKITMSPLNFSNIRKKNIAVVFISAIFVFLITTQFVSAIECSGNPNDWSGVKKAQCGLQSSANTGYGTNVTSDSPGIITNLSSGIGTIVGAGLAFIGVLFMILMIYGGIVWMMARGNEQEVTKAKQLIEAAIIGLVIVLSAYAITSFIGGKLTTTQ